MNIEKLLKKMEKGICLVKYTSLNSGEEKHRELTLNPKYTRGVTVPSDIGGEKILAYDIEFQKWDDIQIDTIINWTEVE